MEFTKLYYFPLLLPEMLLRGIGTGQAASKPSQHQLVAGWRLQGMGWGGHLSAISKGKALIAEH